MSREDPPGKERLERRFGSLEAAWSALAEKGLDALEEDPRKREALKARFVEAGRSASATDTGGVPRLARALGRYWLETLVVAGIALLVAAALVRGQVAGTRAVAARDLGSFEALGDTVVRLERVRLGLGGFRALEEVRGRVVLRALPAGTPLRPEHLTDYRLSGDRLRRLAAATVLSVPLQGAFDGALTPGREATLLAVHSPGSASDARCRAFRDVLVLAVDAAAAPGSAVVALPDDDVAALASVLAQSGASVRPVVGTGGCPPPP